MQQWRQVDVPFASLSLKQKGAITAKIRCNPLIKRSEKGTSGISNRCMEVIKYKRTLSSKTIQSGGAIFSLCDNVNSSNCILWTDPLNCSWLAPSPVFQLYILCITLIPLPPDTVLILWGQNTSIMKKYFHHLSKNQIKKILSIFEYQHVVVVGH